MIQKEISASALSSDGENVCFEEIMKLCEACDQGEKFSYRQICDRLGFTFTKSGSNARKAQIKQIGCYCHIKRSGTGSKYILSDPHQYEKIVSKKATILMERFHLTPEEATEPCYFAIVSIRTNYGILCECDNLTKEYSKMYEESLTRQQVSYGGLLMEPHFVQVWLKSKPHVNRNYCIYDLENQNIFILNKHSEAKGRALHKMLENQLQMCNLFVAIEHICKEYNWDEEMFVDKLILNIEKNPGRWIQNTIMCMHSSRGSRGGLDVGDIFDDIMEFPPDGIDIDYD